MTVWVHFKYRCKLMKFACLCIFQWHLNDFGIDFGLAYFGIELILVRIDFGNDWIKELIFLLYMNDWTIERINLVS